MWCVFLCACVCVHFNNILQGRLYVCVFVSACGVCFFVPVCVCVCVHLSHMYTAHTLQGRLNVCVSACGVCPCVYC